MPNVALHGQYSDEASLLLFHQVELIQNNYLNGTLVQMLLDPLYRLKRSGTCLCEVFYERHDAYLAPLDSGIRIGALGNAKHEAFTPKDTECSLSLVSFLPSRRRLGVRKGLREYMFSHSRLLRCCGWSGYIKEPE